MRTLLFVACLGLVACSSSAKTPAPPSHQGGSDAGETSCTSDADCVVVETGCCDHCNGGKAEAFNTAFADAHKPTGCPDVACTEMACGAATASCEAGTCKVTIEPLQ